MMMKHNPYEWSVTYRVSPWDFWAKTLEMQFELAEVMFRMGLAMNPMLAAGFSAPRPAGRKAAPAAPARTAEILELPKPASRPATRRKPAAKPAQKPSARAMPASKPKPTAAAKPATARAAKTKTKPPAPEKPPPPRRRTRAPSAPPQPFDVKD